MKIETSSFGIIEIEEEKVINFEQSILGFEDYTKFTIIDNLDDDLFYWLQSLEKPDLSFIMINPVQFVDDYQINLSDKFQEKLGLDGVVDKDIIVYTLVVIGDDGSYITTNLKAPIIINTQSQKAGQLVLEKDYPTKYYLYQEQKLVEEMSG